MRLELLWSQPHALFHVRNYFQISFAFSRLNNGVVNTATVAPASDTSEWVCYVSQIIDKKAVL